MARSKKYSVLLKGHSTSITLEPAFLDALKMIAKRSGQSVSRLIETIDASGPDNLSSAIRVYVLDYFIKRAGL